MIKTICFHGNKDEIGGGQIPAFAFHEWLGIFGIESKIGFEIDNDADWLFLATPGRMMEELIKDIEVPFAMMIHAEFDVNIYPSLPKLLKNSNCKLIVVIGEQYWDFDQPQLYWHPCTLPYYLMTEGDNFDNSNRYGLLYSARISKWKGINKLSALSKFKPFLDSVDHRIDVFGKQTSDFIIEPGNYTLVNKGVDIYDKKSICNLYRQYKYFWDVSGSKEYDIKIKRLNLAAIEAMKFGVIPIADGKTAYPFSKKFMIDLENGFPGDFVFAQEKMKEDVLNSPICYDAVEKQVKNIIDFMESDSGSKTIV